MKRVGFIDYYLHEWHADNYPRWIAEQSGGRYGVTCAWAAVDCPLPGRKTNAQWASEQGITLCGSIEQVIDQSDVLVVLSPDNPEQHEALCELALASGKPVFVDKTFAPTHAAARRMLTRAQAHGTPCFSSSALRFASEIRSMEPAGIHALAAWGPGEYDNYAIHQIEPIVTLLGTQAERVLFTGTPRLPALTIEFSGGRVAGMVNFAGGSDFIFQAAYEQGEAVFSRIESDFFQNFIDELLVFFDTGISPVPHEQTLAVAAIREAGLIAAGKPGIWVDLPL